MTSSPAGLSWRDWGEGREGAGEGAAAATDNDDADAEARARRASGAEAEAAHAAAAAVAAPAAAASLVPPSALPRRDRAQHQQHPLSSIPEGGRKDVPRKEEKRR